MQQYGDWYIGAVDEWLLHLVQREGPGRAVAPFRALLPVSNVTAHPSTASVSTSYYSIWHYN